MRHLSSRFLLVLLWCIACASCEILRQPTLDGTEKVRFVRPEWFGAVNDGKTDCTEAIQRMFDFMAQYNVYDCKFDKCEYEKNQYYLISKTIYIRKPVKIDGHKAFISSRSLITLGNDPNNKAYLTDGIAFRILGTKETTPKCTDISINIKVHAKPFYLDRLKNAYFHDCTVSTFTGDTAITRGTYTFWYAFQCDELCNARFENIHIDQPTWDNKYNSGDGIHLSGGCHDIMIQNVWGQAGDDFIAMNTNENHSGDIYNIIIRNCTIGKDKISRGGIRFYGCSRLSHVYGKPQLKISNVKIYGCDIRTDFSPCVFFANNGFWGIIDKESQKLAVNDVSIKNCNLHYESKYWKDIPAIFISGTECDNLEFERIFADKSTHVPLFGLNGFNDIKAIDIKRCGKKNMSDVEIYVKKDEEFVKNNSEATRGNKGEMIFNKNTKKGLLIRNGIVSVK